MGRIIPNEESWIAFSPVVPALLAAPTTTEISAAGVINLTKRIISLNASSSGNTVPTPDIGSLFETSVPGTSSATFSLDLYRDDVPANDIGWTTLVRGAKGVFYVSRFGGSGTLNRPEDGEPVEVWPVTVTSRASSPLASNTAQMFTVTCAVPTEPEEDAVVTLAA